MSSKEQIAERRQTEQALRESEKRFRDFFENSPDAIFVEDLDGNVLDVNPAACRLHGLEYDELVGKHVLDLIPPDQREAATRNFLMLASGELDHTEGFSWVGEGRAVPVEIKVSHIDYAGRPALLLHVRDVTERKRVEASLERRAIQLQVAAEVARAATSELDLTTLLGRTVELIRERFGFYYASIYLLDDYQRFAVIQAAAGEMGEDMLAQEHKLEVGGQSLIGTVTATGEARLVTGARSPLYVSNSFLPGTQAAVSLPLIARGQIIGALDVQSIDGDAFTQDDVTVLQTMADQIANAIVAARLLEEAHQDVEKGRASNKQYLQGEWKEFLRSKRSLQATTFYLNGAEDAQPGDDLWLPEMRQALEEDRSQIVPASTHHDEGFEGVNNDLPFTMDDEQRVSLVAPITLGEQVIGLLDFFTTDETHEWTEDDLAIVEMVRTQAALALENARLFQETRLALEETASLYRVTRTLAQIDNEQEMFELVLTEYLEYLNLQQGSVFIFDNDKVAGTLMAHIIAGEPAEPRLQVSVAGSPIHHQLIRTKEPVVINDVSSDDLVGTMREFTLELGIKSLLLVPILVRGEVIGALGADATETPHEFADREIALVHAMADQLGIALENRQLLAETQRLALQLQTGADVGRVITSNLDLDVLLGETVELIRDRFGFAHAQIFLLDDEGKWAVLHKSTGQIGQELLARGHKLPVGSQSVIGQVTAKRRTLIARDVDSDLVHRPNVLLPDTRAEIAIPLQVGEKLIGALDVQSNESNAFTENDILTLELLAAQLTVAIENARAFTEQQASAERLRELDRMKTQFLANMSHELRTPLNSIIGFSRVILKGIDGPITELQHNDLTAIYNSGQHLLGLINNILDLSKIEAGKFELNFEEVDLGQIIKVVMSTAVALVKDKDVELIQDVPDELPRIYADQTRIRQIILNLIANAAKFTQYGSITLTVRVESGYVVISVKDTGIGIPPDKVEHIFEEFTQVDASTTRHAGGTGLGLPITRYLVEMHNGTIDVQSKAGSGATFTIRLPIDSEVAEAVSAMSSFEVSAKEVADRILLVVDDDEGVATLYQRYLHAQNYHIIPLTESQNVVVRAKEIEPYAILLDILMPGKDGWTVLRELKEDPQTRDIPVIIASIVAARDRGLSLGAIDYLRKPIMESDLRDALNKLESSARERRRVLVVDDQADDILLIRRVLEAQGNYQVIEASDGATGLELVRRKQPELIILDLMMPEMDGFAVVESLKANPRTRPIPIIVVTAKDVTREEQKYLDKQAEATLHKGIFSETELVVEVSKVLEHT